MTNYAKFGNSPQCDGTELEEFRTEIRKLYDMKDDSLAAGEVEPIVERFYTADAVSFGPDAKVVTGREALTQHYHNFLQAFASAKVVSVKQYVRNGLGWDWANFIATAKDGSVIHAPMIFLWLKTSEGWVSCGDVFAINADGAIDWGID